MATSPRWRDTRTVYARVKSDDAGNIDLDDFKAKAEKPRTT